MQKRISMDIQKDIHSSENFPGLKYCANAHNIVTIHLLLILYNK
jgi:hypothetical protein